MWAKLAESRSRLSRFPRKDPNFRQLYEPNGITHLLALHLRFHPRMIRSSVDLAGTVDGKKARGDLSGQKQAALKTSDADSDEDRDDRGRPSIRTTISCCLCHGHPYCPDAGDDYCCGGRSANPCVGKNPLRNSPLNPWSLRNSPSNLLPTKFDPISTPVASSRISDSFISVNSIRRLTSAGRGPSGAPVRESPGIRSMNGGAFLARKGYSSSRSEGRPPRQQRVTIQLRDERHQTCPSGWVETAE